MKVMSWRALAVLMVGIAVGWVSSRVAGGAEAAGEGAVAEVLASVGDSRVTQAEVEAARPTEFLRLKREMHHLTEQALERAIQIELVRLEADARGVEPAELVKEEVDDRVPDPSDEEVAAFHRDRRLQGPLEQLAPRIREHLRDQARNQRYAAFLEELGEKYPVERLMGPLRAEVASEGYPARGPEDAPVTIVEFSDFQCPYCFQFLGTLDQVQQAYGERVRLVYRHFPLESIHPDAQKAAEASLCAHEQGRFWEMHDAMFADQQALGVEALERTAESLGLDVGRFSACLDSDTYADEVAADLQAGRQVGVTGTPAIFVNGRFLSGTQTFDAVAEIIDDELRRAGLSVERRPLEPVRTAVEAEGFPAKGPEDAPVTIVEFSDFECPYCGRMAGAIAQVVDTYSERVRVVFRQFPLTRIHPNAQKAAEASLCAHEQGRFWEMHDAMFADQQALQVDRLKETARALGLEAGRFDGCLDGGQYVDEVAADLQAGREAGVTGTPALFINGRFLSGAKPFEEIAAVIDDELARASS